MTNPDENKMVINLSPVRIIASAIYLFFAPVSATFASVLDLTYSFEAITLNGNNVYRFDFTLTPNSPDIYNIPLNNIFIGDFEYANDTLSSNADQTLSPVTSQGVGIGIGGNAEIINAFFFKSTFGADAEASLTNENLVAPFDPLALHMGLRLSFGQGGDGHGWKPLAGTDAQGHTANYSWSTYIAQPVNQLYFSYEDDRPGLSAPSQFSENWQLAHGPSPVPEPQTYALMLLGLAWIGMVKTRRRRAAR